MNLRDKAMEAAVDARSYIPRLEMVERVCRRARAMTTAGSLISRYQALPPPLKFLKRYCHDDAARSLAVKEVSIGRFKAWLESATIYKGSFPLIRTHGVLSKE